MLKCFVIMPFADEFVPVYEQVRRTAAVALAGEDLECYWLKDIYAAGRITDDILAEIQRATLCIADVSGSNANVMWETGYAMALGKPTILICQSLARLPFDLHNHRVIDYTPATISDRLGEPLAKAMQQTIERYASKPSFSPEAARKKNLQTIAVTGSMVADRARVRRRAESLLAPYLSCDTIWHCGSVGDVDETVLDYLLENQQRSVVVGYRRFDISPHVQDLVNAQKCDFRDASVESVPLDSRGPSERDTLFASKADLVVLFWDGKSPGTAELLRFYTSIHKSTLIGFI